MKVFGIKFNNMLKAHKNKFLLSVIGSYMSITVVFLLVLGMILGIYQQYYERENKSFNDYLFYNIAASANKVVSDMDKLKISLQKNETVKEFLRTDKNDVFLNEITYKTISEIKQLQYANTDVNLFFIYLKDIDSIVYEGGILSGKFFYEMWFCNEDMTYEEWKEELFRQTTDRYLLFDGKDRENNQIEYLSLVFRASVEDGAIGVVMSDKRNMMSGLGKIEWQNECCIYIFNPLGRLVVSNVRDSSELPRSVEDVLKNSRNNFELFQSESIISNNKWQTVVAIQKNELLYGVRMIRLIIFIILICSVILLFFIILYLVKQNYRPVQKVFNLLNITGNEQKMETVYHKIKHIMNRYEYLSKETEIKDKNMIDNYLTSLLKGTYFNQKINFKFIGHSFYVLIFQIKDIKKFFVETDYSEDIKKYHLNFVIENVVSEKLLQKSIKCHFLMVDDKFVCITESEEAIDVQEMLKTVTEGIEFINSNFDIQLFYTVSLPCTSVSGLSIAFNQSVEAMEYVCFYEVYHSLFYQEFIDRLNDDIISFNVKIFSNFIKNAYEEKACDNITTLFKFIKNNQNISVLQVRFMAIQIVNVLESYNQSHTLEDVFIINKTINYKEISNLNSISEIYQYLIDYTCRTCNEISVLRAKRRAHIQMSEVVQYIEENFTDQKINVNAIAEHFCVRADYLSRVFKKQIGIQMLDFINFLRVERANVLMNQNKNKFEEILAMSGFNNERTFFRIKKKMKDMNAIEIRNNLNLLQTKETLE